jgi:hypothetical protein
VFGDQNFFISTFPLSNNLFAPPLILEIKKGGGWRKDKSGG